jgi:hypothetical protein
MIKEMKNYEKRNNKRRDNCTISRKLQNNHTWFRRDVTREGLEKHQKE